MANLIYLDNNATTKVDEKVLEVMLPYFSQYYGNPSSIYEFGGKNAKAIAQAREIVKDFFGAKNPKEIIFTASGSESANTAIRGVLSADKSKNHLITTKVEHPCVLNLHKQLEKEGYRVTYAGVNSAGELNIEEIIDAVTDKTALVSCMYANNETGALFPVEIIAEKVKSKNKDTKIFVDAVQAAGKIDINVQNTQIDMMGISGHKFHAPKGIGALYVNSSTLITPLIIGGHQERGKRAGTENVPFIIGLAKAAELAKNSLDYETNEVKRLRDKLERGILSKIYNAKLNSSAQNRVPNTTNIGFEYVEGELILLNMNDFGICASSGSACTSGSLDPSHVLKAMGVPFTALHGSIRFSLSRYTTEDEIDFTIEKMPVIIDKLAKISPFQKELNELKQRKGII
ncbi:MAG: cysteine desulfurase NifS [Candidatus Gastranaerophilales bacterium]|nr:cysteine desulfurase NifS [Candidatus Gastranaerophilales bacterium]